MSAAIDLAIGTIAVAIAGAIATLASWFRERRTAIHAEEATRASTSRYGTKVDIDLLNGPQSRLDEAQADAVSKLLVALNNTPEAVIQIGEVILVKHGGRTLARSLSGRELRYLERNRKLLENPAEAFAALGEMGTPFNGDPAEELKSGPRQKSE